MTVDFVIRNAKIVRPDRIFSGWVAIKNGIFVSIGEYGETPKAERSVDAKGKYVLPGIIDPHVHWGTKKDYDLEVRNETRACARGGVTTVSTLIGHAKNYCDGSYFDSWDRWVKETNRESLIDTFFEVSPHTDQHIDEIPRYARELGVTMFKFFKGYKGEDERKKMGIGWVDDALLYFGFKAIGQLGYPAIARIHCENGDISNYITPKLIKQGRDDLAAWDEGRPTYSEELEATKAIAFARATNCPLYIVHISAAGTVDAVKKANLEGQHIIGETCPHYLVLTKYRKLGNYGKVNPPIRDQENADRLWQGIREGTITTMGTDNVPCYRMNKGGTVWDAHPGLPNGSATFLPLMITEGVLKGRITLEKLVEVCSYNTARTFGIYPKKGTIDVGSDADLVIVDMDNEVEITPETLLTSTDFTVYQGWKLKGFPTLTMLRGNVIMEDGKIVGKNGYGQIIPCKLAAG